MKTRLTELLGIKHPTIQASMAYVATPELVAAVSNAGGLGMLSTALTSPEELRRDIAAVKQLTSQPFGISLIPFSPGLRQLAEVIIEGKVPLVASSFGRPREIFELFKGCDIIRMAVVGSVRHAVGAERDGANVIIAEGIETAGHVSSVGSMVLMPKVTVAVKIPVVASGGYSMGKQLAAAIALGAEGIYMGTRFMLTKESPVAESIKQRFLQASAEDTIVTTKIDGYPFRIINNKLAQQIGRRRLNRLWQTIPILIEMKRTYNASWSELARAALKVRSTFHASAAGMVVIIKMNQDTVKGGNPEERLLACGQGIELIEDLPTCQDLIEQIVKEAEEALKRGASSCQFG